MYCFICRSVCCLSVSNVCLSICLCMPPVCLSVCLIPGTKLDRKYQWSFLYTRLARLLSYIGEFLFCFFLHIKVCKYFKRKPVFLTYDISFLFLVYFTINHVSTLGAKDKSKRIGTFPSLCVVYFTWNCVSTRGSKHSAFITVQTACMQLSHLNGKSKVLHCNVQSKLLVYNYLYLKVESKVLVYSCIP